MDHRRRPGNPEFEWLVESSGAWNAPDEAQQKDRKPNWVRKRDRVIAGVYLGEVEFDQEAEDKLSRQLAGTIFG